MKRYDDDNDDERGGGDDDDDVEREKPKEKSEEKKPDEPEEEVVNVFLLHLGTGRDGPLESWDLKIGKSQNFPQFFPAFLA